jgi:hypothetical protein
LPGGFAALSGVTARPSEYALAYVAFKLRIATMHLPHRTSPPSRIRNSSEPQSVQP